MGSHVSINYMHRVPIADAQLARSLTRVTGSGGRIVSENTWRNPRQIDQLSEVVPPWIIVSRWVDRRQFSRVEHAHFAPDRYVIGIALKATRLTLSRDSATVFEGTMSAGTAYVTDGSRPLKAELHDPCDFVHVHVDSGQIDPHALTVSNPALANDRALDGYIARDALVEHLARSLVETDVEYDELYAQSVGHAIVARLLAHRRAQSKAAAPRVNPLQQWRLKRVNEFVDEHIDRPIRLAEMASVARVSRMHFAAQFKAATGFRPHDYLLTCRIERAKELLSRGNTPLVQIALSTGFQTQAHFTTVFKKRTGRTPAQWKRGATETRDRASCIPWLTRRAASDPNGVIPFRQS